MGGYDHIYLCSRSGRQGLARASGRSGRFVKMAQKGTKSAKRRKRAQKGVRKGCSSLPGAASAPEEAVRDCFGAACAFEKVVRDHYSKVLGSATLCSEPLYSALLCSVHVYARVHTSICIHIVYTHMCTSVKHI